LEDCIIVLILFKNIDKILLKDINIYVIAVLIKPFVLNRVDFVDLIILKNKR